MRRIISRETRIDVRCRWERARWRGDAGKRVGRARGGDHRTNARGANAVLNTADLAGDETLQLFQFTFARRIVASGIRR